MISPVQALRDLMTIMNIEQNKLGSAQQIKNAYAKAREYLPDIEDWEKKYETVAAEKEILRQEKESTAKELEALKKELEITRSNSDEIKQLLKQQSINETLSVKPRTQSREELRVTKAREEVLKQQWEDLKNSTEAKLQ